MQLRSIGILNAILWGLTCSAQTPTPSVSPSATQDSAIQAKMDTVPATGKITDAPAGTTETTEETLKRLELKKLHVDVADSCSIVVKMAKDPEGPFLPTSKCDEDDFAPRQRVVYGTVYRILDGDTIHFFVKDASGEKVLYGIRMLGIDTPELHYYSRSQPVWGLAARDHLRSMIKPGDKIKVEFDGVKCDHYGRILGHVFKNNVNINFEQVRSGMAANYCIAPNLKHCSAYALAYHQAQEEKIGIHTDACVVTPYVWRRAMDSTPMDKKVMDTRDQKIYKASDYYLVPVQYRIFYPAGK